MTGFGLSRMEDRFRYDIILSGDNMISNGIDIVNHKRFQNFPHLESFLKKYFTEEERKYIEERDRKEEGIAGIYATKEAFLKALHQGISSYSLQEIEVLHHKEGDPYIVLHGNIKKDTNIKTISVSISHDGDYTISSVILFL